ncbi:BON domain-containing protein [Catenovulum sediminis]|uniref:BON domain-containing protein n=1 Tax=Catenovulum sediminis TaxID=1740262 RepID=A0ABV1RJD8_9ALTE|nr:BON domain-containing protein [Catenovulum sediminis]
MKNSLNKLLIAGVLSSFAVVNGANAGDSNTWQDTSKDAWIDGKAEATILFNTQLSAFDINTDVEKGHVILTGKVDSEVDKALAEEIVESLEGVKGVENHLIVVNQDKSKDSQLMASLNDSKVATVVKTKLLLESEVGGTDINVEVKNGVVTLKGEVESASEKQLAVAIAQNTDDVKNVINQLKVNNS